MTQLLQRARAKKAAEKEEAKTMNLDERKAQQTGGNKDQPKLNLRKADEGSDPAQQAGANKDQPNFNLRKAGEGYDLNQVD